MQTKMIVTKTTITMALMKTNNDVSGNDDGSSKDDNIYIYIHDCFYKLK